ncbi:Rho-N 1 [Hibiscus trionum]|uniref:Rho-N 1 n=1 Tax=Hibiscus trionum TaxID=183268 RepID=A0A9W7LKA9_HIBTR|nr:Rho-N 1 [Hibiscus trionum]
MSHALRLVSGYGPTDSKYLSCSSISGRAVTRSFCSSRSDLRICSQVKVGSSKCGSRGISFACKAGSDGHRRSLDFSRQRHGFQGRNRQNEDKDSFENLDDSELLSSKSVPFLSLSDSTKFQATAAPAPREQEVVELLKKVQAKLQERAAAKGDKTEAFQRKSKESETVNSLLKLLRKHSVEQGKKKDGNNNSSDLNSDHPVVNGPSNEDKSSSFFGSNDRVRIEDSAPTLSRPASNFRRKSPVPRLKYQQVYSSEETANSDLSLAESPPAPYHVPELEAELEPESEPESILQEPNMLDELSDNESLNVDTDETEQQIEHEDLSALKLPELRALAKSRGLKGFTKMKKGELVVLLSSTNSG